MAQPTSCYNCNDAQVACTDDSANELLQLYRRSSGSYRWLSQPVVTTVTTLKWLVPMAQPTSCYNCNDAQVARIDDSANELLQL